MNSIEHHDISARRVRFDWTDTPLHWVPGDPFATHTINVLHLLLPAGERWFCKVLRQALPLIEDDKLRDDVKGFIGQEAVHARSHQAVLDQHLAAHGVDTTAYTKRIDYLFENLLDDRPRLPAWLQRRWLIRRLALVAAIEHFTAVLGSWIVDNTALDEAGADQRMMDLLRWHGAEEVEHRSVAFDLYQHVSGGRINRSLAMVVASIGLAVCWSAGIVYFFKNDPILNAAAQPGGQRVKVRWHHWRRSSRRGLLPKLGHLIFSIPRYFKPGFHPSEEGDLEAAVHYLEHRSPAVAEIRAS